jgi:hypothetical protein
MKAQELIAVVFGAGFIWKLPFFSTPGPCVCLTKRNTPRGNDEYPEVLEIENVGDKPAQNLEWEVRDYYGTVLPRYELRREHRVGPLKPGESFVIHVGSESADVALLGDFEIIVSYSGLNRARFFSHFAIDGHVKRNNAGINRAQWMFTFPLLRIWVRHFLSNFLSYTHCARRFPSAPDST